MQSHVRRTRAAAGSRAEGRCSRHAARAERPMGADIRRQPADMLRWPLAGRPFLYTLALARVSVVDGAAVSHRAAPASARCVGTAGSTSRASVGCCVPAKWPLANAVAVGLPPHDARRPSLLRPANASRRRRVVCSLAVVTPFLFTTNGESQCRSIYWPAHVRPIGTIINV